MPVSILCDRNNFILLSHLPLRSIWSVRFNSFLATVFTVIQVRKLYRAVLVSSFENSHFWGCYCHVPWKQRIRLASVLMKQKFALFTDKHQKYWPEKVTFLKKQQLFCSHYYTSFIQVGLNYNAFLLTHPRWAMTSWWQLCFSQSTGPLIFTSYWEIYLLRWDRSMFGHA